MAPQTQFGQLLDEFKYLLAAGIDRAALEVTFSVSKMTSLQNYPRKCSSDLCFFIIFYTNLFNHFSINLLLNYMNVMQKNRKFLTKLDFFT